MLARAALGGIWLYQSYISPRKGFRCAYSVLHDDTGCSGFAKHTIKQHGFWRAIPLVRQRFAACKIAYFTLREEQEQARKSRKKTDSCAKQMRDGCCDAACMEGRDLGTSCFGRAATKPLRSCDADCDVCSCG